MPSYHLLRCVVTLGGEQPGTQVYRDRTRPIVYPELSILQNMHGEDAVADIHVVGQWDTTNEEVLSRLQLIYGEDAVREVYPGTRPRLPPMDPSLPRCTLPIYRPKPVTPDSPDPRLTPLDQFTMQGEIVEGPTLPPDTIPTPDEIAAHAQDDDVEDDAAGMGLVPEPKIGPGIAPGDLPRVMHSANTPYNASSRNAPASTTPSYLPDVGAGGSHAPAAKYKATRSGR